MAKTRAQLQAEGAQIANETGKRQNTASRVGNALLDLLAAIAVGVFDVTAYGASVSGTGASNDTAIASALTDAVAANAILFWPAGTYVSAANLSSFHAVRHIGPGAIQRGSDVFYVQPQYGQTNRLYVSVSGSSAANDGLSSSQPCTLAQACANLRNYGPVLNGTWKIIGTAETYPITASVAIDTPSRDWVIVQGPDVGGHPNVPTMILDGASAAAGTHGFVITGIGVQIWFQDIKCQNFSASTTTCGWAQGYAARCIGVNCHASNCSFAGWLADQGDICLIQGGIFNGCRDGIVLNSTKGTVGYGGSALGNSTRITGCTEFGLYWSRGAQGHCDYVFFDQNAIALRIESAARAHVLGSDFRRSTSYAIGTNTDGSYYEDVSIVNAFNDGGANANTKRYFTGAFSGKQQNWTDTGVSEFRVYMDDTTRSLTNVAKTQIGADVYTLPVSYFVDNATKIRVKIFLETPNAVTSIGVDFFNASPGATVMDYSQFVGTPSAAGAVYECEIFPTAVTAQRVFAKADSSGVAPRVQNGASAANMALAQTIRLMGQSAAGTITVRRVEVWVTG